MVTARPVRFTSPCTIRARASRSNTRMTAIVCHDPEDYRVEQVERDGRTKTTRARVAARSGKDI